MRKVTVQIWKPKDGKANYEQHDGLFHCWGSELFEQNDGPAVSFTVAIVELEDGSVIESPPSLMRFIDAPEEGRAPLAT